MVVFLVAFLPFIQSGKASIWEQVAYRTIILIAVYPCRFILAPSIRNLFYFCALYRRSTLPQNENWFWGKCGPLLPAQLAL